MTPLCSVCQRRTTIAKAVSVGEIMSYAVIMERFGVSLATAKRDIAALVRAGFLPDSKRRRAHLARKTR